MELVQEGENRKVLIGGKEAALQKVELNARCVKPQHELRKHERLALLRNLPQLMRVDPHNQIAILCGTAPSIEGQLDQIKKLRKEDNALLVAIKGSHDWLISKGVIPDIAVAVDPQPKIADIYRKPKHEITYFIASQCHPDTFDALNNHKVVLWHLYTKSSFKYWSDFLHKKKKRKEALSFVGGGSTSGLRAISLVYHMGFRKMHLFGYDSCIPENSDILKITGEKAHGQQIVFVTDDGLPSARAFTCNGAMSCQAGEFDTQMRALPDLRVKCWGDGLIQHISRQGARRGMNNYLLEDETWDSMKSPERGTLEPLPPEPPVINTQEPVHVPHIHRVG